MASINEGKLSAVRIHLHGRLHHIREGIVARDSALPLEFMGAFNGLKQDVFNLADMVALDKFGETSVFTKVAYHLLAVFDWNTPVQSLDNRPLLRPVAGLDGVQPTKKYANGLRLQPAQLLHQVVGRTVAVLPGKALEHGVDFFAGGSITGELRRSMPASAPDIRHGGGR